MPGKYGVVWFMLIEILKRIVSQDFKTLNEGQISCQRHNVYEVTLRKVVSVIQVIVFWAVTPCSLASESQRFGGTFCLQSQVRVRKDSAREVKTECLHATICAPFAISHIKAHICNMLVSTLKMEEPCFSEKFVNTRRHKSANITWMHTPPWKLKKTYDEIINFSRNILRKCGLTFWHRSFTFNSNKSPTWCRPARPRTQHDYHHDTKIKPETATAVIELLMMGGKTPETCWAVNKRQDNKQKNCYIRLVTYLN